MRNILILLFLILSISSFADEFGWKNDDGSLAKNTEEMKSIKGFGGWLVVTPDKDWEEKWNTPESHTPNFSTAKYVKLGEELTILIFYGNATPDTVGNISVKCDIKVRKPDDTYSINARDVECAHGAQQGDPLSVRLTETIIKYVGEDGDPLGKWLVSVVLKDNIAGIEVPLKTEFTLQLADTSLQPTAEEVVLEPASWSFPEVIQHARKIAPQNIEGKPFNNFGLVYTEKEASTLSLSTLPASELQKYADIVTHAYPDAVAKQLPNSCEVLPVEQLNETSLGGIAYVSINAKSEAARAKAKACFSVLQKNLAKLESTMPNKAMHRTS